MIEDDVLARPFRVRRFCVRRFGAGRFCACDVSVQDHVPVCDVSVRRFVADFSVPRDVLHRNGMNPRTAGDRGATAHRSVSSK